MIKIKMTYTPKVIKTVGKEAQTFSPETVNYNFKFTIQFFKFMC